MRPVERKDGDAWLLYDADRVAEAAAQIFEPEWWAARGALLGGAPGRGTTHFVRKGDEAWALRHYRRGGWVSWVGDRYLWLGRERNRAWREWRLTAELHAQGLPVPVPVAVRVRRSGITYCADLITLRLADAASLAQLLQAEPLPSDRWRELGGLLRRSHRAGVCHADLNAHNILITPRGFFVIDFDKARLRTAGRWSEKNLQRLRRSLDKLSRLAPGFHFQAADWTALLEGYSSASA